MTGSTVVLVLSMLVLIITATRAYLSVRCDCHRIARRVADETAQLRGTTPLDVLGRRR